MRLRWALALALAAPVAAKAATAGDPVVAERLVGSIDLDGRLDEPGWSRAPPYDGFVQLFPVESAPPSDRTIVRVLYDDRSLYVGILCEHADAARIVRTLGRRDAAPFSDYVLVYVDSMRDRRTGYAFGISAAGVQEDFLYYDDESFTAEWDAVWGGATADAPGGWSAELVIPLSALRFTRASEQVWGFAVRRIVASSHEETSSVLVRRDERGTVSRLGTLVGLRDLRPARDLEILPYLALRLWARPEGIDPQPRDVDPIADVGFDLKTSIGRALALQATVNPDFGQVEADQIVQNLTRYELFLPEKRPFFMRGMDLFQPVTPAGRESPQQLFYSRRIGLDAPILGAAKLTGQIGDVQIGVLDGFLTGSDPPGPAEPPFTPEQPFHLAPARTYPATAPASRNFLAAAARWHEAPKRTFGLAFTSALGTDRCTEGDVQAAEDAGVAPPPHCQVLTGNAAALDWSVRDSQNELFFRGQVSGSQYLGGAPRLTLVDGTTLERGDLGLGWFASAGREGGEPWRFDVTWEYETPELQLNATGFQRTQNEQVGRATVTYARPKGNRVFHSWDAGIGGELKRTTDGRRLSRGRAAWAWAQAQLKSFHKLGCNANVEAPAWDVREIIAQGIAYERPGAWSLDCWVSTDQARPLSALGKLAYGSSFVRGPLPALDGWAGTLVGVWRPHPRFESRVDLQYTAEHQPARWIGFFDDGGGQRQALFADLRAPAFSLTLREQVVLSPSLTIQAYAQLFSTYYDYGDTWSALAEGVDRIRVADVFPSTRSSDEADGRDAALNVNLVLRWEYRRGSTLYLVYARTQSEPTGDDRTTLAPRSLGDGPATDTVLVKWSYWWNR